MKKTISIFSALSLLLTLFLTGCGNESRPKLGNTLILGDSYSTFQGEIPTGYPAYYTKNSKDIGVDRVYKTWWHRLLRKTNATLLMNSSYSGSTVCHTGYNGDDYSSLSFLHRMEVLAESGYFTENRVDTLIVFGGLNDYWANSPLGEIKYESITESDEFYFFPALSKMLGTVRTVSPETRIIFVVCELLSDEMKNGISEICTYYGAETAEPKNVTIESGHPNAEGMKKICDDILFYLMNN
ncbi:MAG: hypothetical protein IKD07_00360 [Clostridia bacterium]|nr:hypothetical protein [Clostridia bacterium]